MDIKSIYDVEIRMILRDGLHSRCFLSEQREYDQTFEKLMEDGIMEKCVGMLVCFSSQQLPGSVKLEMNRNGSYWVTMGGFEEEGDMGDFVSFGKVTFYMLLGLCASVIKEVKHTVFSDVMRWWRARSLY